MMIPDDFVDSTEFCSIKTTASLQPDRIEPELGDLVLTLDVNMCGSSRSLAQRTIDTRLP
jgi:hypothetical protein